MGLSILHLIGMTHICSSVMEKKASNTTAGNASVMVCVGIDRISDIAIWSGSNFPDHSILYYGIV